MIEQKTRPRKGSPERAEQLRAAAQESARRRRVLASEDVRELALLHRALAKLAEKYRLEEVLAADDPAEPVSIAP